MKLQFHLPLAMWNQTKKIIEEENKQQKEQEEGHNLPTSTSGMMNYAKSMASSSGIKMPSGMPNLSSFRMP